MLSSQVSVRKTMALMIVALLVAATIQSEFVDAAQKSDLIFVKGKFIKKDKKGVIVVEEKEHHCGCHSRKRWIKGLTTIGENCGPLSSKKKELILKIKLKFYNSPFWPKGKPLILDWKRWLQFTTMRKCSTLVKLINSTVGREEPWWEQHNYDNSLSIITQKTEHKKYIFITLTINKILELNHIIVV